MAASQQRFRLKTSVEHPIGRKTPMRCVNCGKDIPDSAKMCQFCEATVEPELTEEEGQAALEALQQLDPETRQELLEALRLGKTGDEFVNRVLVGKCPKCGSASTDDCENDPEIEDILVGRCSECGHLWCTRCGRPLKGNAPYCECWGQGEGEEEE
jgi:hypothetical protein